MLAPIAFCRNAENGYQWLSNMHPFPFEFRGRMWGSAEIAYCYYKVVLTSDDAVLLKDVRDEVESVAAKKKTAHLSKHLKWLPIRQHVMLAFLIGEYRTDPLRRWLMQTGDQPLYEATRDRFCAAV